MIGQARYVIAGIDTDAGKTLVSAVLCAGLKAGYHKPVQAGRDPQTDTERVVEWARPGPERIIPEQYLLDMPASPHAAAEAEGIGIDPDRLKVPDYPGTLLIEGAGGLMVPLRPDFTYLDLMARWQLPVILVVRTYLGCINHSLLSLEALRNREIPLAGIVFNDGGRPESKPVILQYAQAPLLGELPRLKDFSGIATGEVFRTYFDWPY